MMLNWDWECCQPFSMFNNHHDSWIKFIFRCSREKLAFRKNIITIELFHQPYMHVVIAFVHHFSMVWICQYIQCTDPLWLQRLMLQVYLTTSKWYVRVTISTLNFAVGVDGNPQPCYFRYLDWGNSIYVTLYMWFTSVINPRVLCVSAYRSRDDT